MHLRRMTALLTQRDLTERRRGAKPHQFLKLKRGRSELIWRSVSMWYRLRLFKRALWRAARRDGALSVPLKRPDTPDTPLQQKDRATSLSLNLSTSKTSRSHFAWCAASFQVPSPRMPALFYTFLKFSTELSANYFTKISRFLKSWPWKHSFVNL